MADWIGVDMPNRICSVPGCGRGGKISRGWCPGHYKRYFKFGDIRADEPLLERPPCPRDDVDPYHYCADALERFWSKVDTDAPTGCWIWTANLARGYGHFRPHMWMPAVMAHRFSFTHLVRPIPDGLQLDHLCRVTACVRPDHLDPVTAQTNVYRSFGLAAHNIRKTHCPRGHELPPAQPGGVRNCLACKRSSAKKCYDRQTEAQRERRRERDRASARYRRLNDAAAASMNPGGLRP